jgi:hypothetical protein
LVVWHFCKTIQTDIASENFIEKTTIKGYQIAQKISYLFSKHQLGCFELQNKENQINFEV